MGRSKSAIRAGLLGAAAALVLFWAPGDEARMRLYHDGAGAPLVEEDVRVYGPGRRYTVATKILRPQGAGPFGAIVLNHGVPLTAAERRVESPELLLETAAVLARRGYAVLMPLRRGFGATGGWFAENAGSCARPNYRGGEAAAAQDIMAAYDFARRLPYSDGSHMILAGQSAGGMASIYAAATRAPEGLVAVLAFAAGRGGDPVRHPGEACAPSQLAELFAELGEQVKVPVLFHYAANDLFFNARTSQLWFDHFRRGSASAEYVLQPPFGENGHYVFTDAEGARHWIPAVGRFLHKHGLPFTPKQAT
jgi:dienelactone hydrolase